jgi:hypothetical protein
MKEPRDHTCARAVRAGDANRRLAISATFHSKHLQNDAAHSASSRLAGTNLQARAPKSLH